MFERKKFKAMAKAQLKGRWKIPVLTTLLSIVIIGIFYGVLFANSNPEDWTVVAEKWHFYANYAPSSPVASAASVFIACIIIIFAVAQLSIHNTMFHEARQIIFSDFTNGLNQWWQAIRAALWCMLWTWLWSLLFIIPGIVKAYSYSQMFYIIAEYPKISVKKAMNISKELTRGYKGELFVLDLSFIGWTILASLSCGIGYLWLSPYMNMTKTNSYQYLKQTAIASNRVKLEDFE